MIAYNDVLINQIGQAVRKGATETASGVYNPTIKAYLPAAMRRFAYDVAQRETVRPLLQREFNIDVGSNGVGVISTSDYDRILHGALRWSYGYCDASVPGGNVPTQAEEETDAEALDTVSRRAIFKFNFADLQSGAWLHPDFDYYSIKDRMLIVKNGPNAYTGKFKLITSYIPDLSSTYPVPEDLRDTLIQSVVNYIQANMPATAPQQPAPVATP